MQQNARLDETQAGIKIARRNISNVRYADDTTLWQKMKIMTSSPITSWQIDGQTMETVRDFILGGSKITADGDCSHEIKDTYSLKEK